MFEYVLNQKGNKFYSLNEDIIIEAEKEMGIIFPEELRSFYIQIGYGFLNTKRDNFNRIMDPYSVCEFRFRTGQFANIFELDIYESYEKDRSSGAVYGACMLLSLCVFIFSECR